MSDEMWLRHQSCRVLEWILQWRVERRKQPLFPFFHVKCSFYYHDYCFIYQSAWGRVAKCGRLFYYSYSYSAHSMNKRCKNLNMYHKWCLSIYKQHFLLISGFLCVFFFFRPTALWKSVSVRNNSWTKKWTKRMQMNLKKQTKAALYLLATISYNICVISTRNMWVQHRSAKFSNAPKNGSEH